MFQKIRSKIIALMSMLLGISLIIATPIAANAQTFKDVKPSNLFYNEIEQLVSMGITKGWDDDTYRPLDDVKRDAMIVFLYRAMGSPDYTAPKKSPFTDVSTSNIFYDEIAWAYDNDISKGWLMKDGTHQFRPLEPVKRDAVAAFLLRASDDKAPIVKNDPFKDVPKNGLFAAEIQWMKDEGISKGWDDNTYRPLTNTKRDAMAAFLIRWMGYTGHNGSGSTIPSSFAVNGSGFGHGVGMSQYGAQEIAKQGKNAEQILEYYYNPAQLNYASNYANSDIRVQTIISSYQKITPVNGSMTFKLNGANYSTNKPVDIKLTNGIRQYIIDGKTITVSSGVDTLTWTNMIKIDRANGSSSAVNYKYGHMRLSTIGSQINISNVLKLNTEYLYGLAEMPASWNSAALEAQAIAGRTYAMRNMSSIKSDCDCNVYDEVKSQKFTGVDVINGSRGDNWKKAVDNTVRKNGSTIASAGVMKHNSSFIDAVYSSSSNGQRTQSGKDMWGGNTAYLQSRPDSYSSSNSNPNRSWTVNASQSKMNTLFGLNNISSISVKKNSSGYAESITATSVDGQKKTVSGAKMRSGLGLKSTGVHSINAK